MVYSRIFLANYPNACRSSEETVMRELDELVRMIPELLGIPPKGGRAKKIGMEKVSTTLGCLECAAAAEDSGEDACGDCAGFSARMAGVRAAAEDRWGRGELYRWKKGGQKCNAKKGLVFFLPYKSRNKSNDVITLAAAASEASAAAATPLAKVGTERTVLAARQFLVLF